MNIKQLWNWTFVHYRNEGIQRQVRGINGTVNLNAAGATAGVAGLNSGLAASRSQLNAARTQAASMNSALQSTSIFGGQASVTLTNMGQQAGIATRRLLAFSIASTAVNRSLQNLKQGIGAAVEFDLAMNKLGQISRDTAQKIDEVRQTIGSLATEYGVSSKSLSSVAITAKQAGLSILETKDGTT